MSRRKLTAEEAGRRLELWRCAGTLRAEFLKAVDNLADHPEDTCRELCASLREFFGVDGLGDPFVVRRALQVASYARGLAWLGDGEAEPPDPLVMAAAVQLEAAAWRVAAWQRELEAFDDAATVVLVGRGEAGAA